MTEPRTEAGRATIKWLDRNWRQLDPMHYTEIRDAILAIEQQAAAQPSGEALRLLERWLYSGGMTRPDLDSLTVDTTLFLDRASAAEGPTDD